MKSKIAEQLEDIMGKEYTRFHMPGHKGRKLFNIDWFNYDFTEIYGSDNLGDPKGVIKEVLEDIANIYGARQSFMLVNGSTTGIIASLMSVCKPGDSFVIPRNSHRCVYSGMILRQINPIYIYPTLCKEYAYSLAINPKEVERLFLQYPECKGIIITSPTYYGTCSDIETILKITHKYNKILIVDEAHGSHFIFNHRFPESAISIGADIVVQSTHKVLNAMTQTGILHIGSSAIDARELGKNINLIQSSSPSYPLLISIENALRHAEKEGEAILDRIINYYDIIQRALRGYPYILLGKNLIGKECISGFDWMKIWITHENLSGKLVDKLLRDRYNIQMELSDKVTFLGLMGMGTQKQDIYKLIYALHEIAEGNKGLPNRKQQQIHYPTLIAVMAPWEAYCRRKNFIALKDSVNEVSGDFIIPYPPGIPLVVPGELLSKEIIMVIQELGLEEIMGLDSQGRICILER
ncbi:MAG: aminotransferase class I/II-fold pyridoxal phosphate-dependent enzyme [Eubacteriales bacterium]